MIKVSPYNHTMNDDDVDFKPSPNTSSNLSHLFSTNIPRPTDNESLIYTAPKAPKTGENCTPKRVSSNKNTGEKFGIFASKSVQAYKLENGNYVNQGTTGVAIIGNYEMHLYQMILYKNNKEYLSKTNITPTFSFIVMNNNYSSFYDNGMQNWTLLFSSSCDVQDFAKQVALAKYNSQTKEERLLVQDLVPAGTMKPNIGDTVIVESVCSVLDKNDINPFKEKHTVHVELSDSDLFPWHYGLKDCSVNCKRVVIVPYRLSAPWTQDIEPNNAILVEFEIESIILSQSGTSVAESESKTSSEKSATSIMPQEEPTTDSSAEEENLKGKEHSITDNKFLLRSQKTKLISRIAKMGQALPLKGTFLSGQSDSEDENMIPSKCTNKSKSLSNTMPQIQQNMAVHIHTDMAAHNGDEESNSEPNNQKRGSDSAYQQSWPLQDVPPAPRGRCPVMSQLEPAGRDAELRISIKQVSEKVDDVLNRLQNISLGGLEKVKEQPSTTVMDPLNVVNSIQGVIAENENLRAEVELQKSKIMEQDSKIQMLIELTQRCVEQCNLTNKKQPATTDSVPPAEEKHKNSEMASEMETSVHQLHLENEKYKKEVFESQTKISEITVQVQDLLQQLMEREETLRNVKEELRQRVKENENLMGVNEDQKQEIEKYKYQNIKETSVSQERMQMASENSLEEIKKVMNAANKKLQSYFSSDKVYTGNEVKITIATTLKDVAVEYQKYKAKQKCTSRTDFDKKEEASTYYTQKRENMDLEDWRQEMPRKVPHVPKTGSLGSTAVDQTLTGSREEENEIASDNCMTGASGSSNVISQTIFTSTETVKSYEAEGGYCVSETLGTKISVSQVTNGSAGSRLIHKFGSIASKDAAIENTPLLSTKIGTHVAESNLPGLTSRKSIVSTVEGEGICSEETGTTSESTTESKETENVSETLSNKLSDTEKGPAILDKSTPEDVKDQDSCVGDRLTGDKVKGIQKVEVEKSILSLNKAVSDIGETGATQTCTLRQSPVKSHPLRYDTTMKDDSIERKEITSAVEGNNEEIEKPLLRQSTIKSTSAERTFEKIINDESHRILPKSRSVQKPSILTSKNESSNSSETIIEEKSENAPSQISVTNEEDENMSDDGISRVTVLQNKRTEKHVSPLKTIENREPLLGRNESAENEFDGYEGGNKNVGKSGGSIGSKSTEEKSAAFKDDLKPFASKSKSNISPYTDFYQSWMPSKPPPLPTDDDDDSSANEDKEWL